MQGLVVTDLAEHVGQAVVGTELTLELTFEWCCLPLGMFLHHEGVFVGSMVFEVSVELIAPFRPNHEQDPRQLVVRDRQDLRDDASLEPRATLIARELFQDQ